MVVWAILYLLAIPRQYDHIVMVELPKSPKPIAAITIGAYFTNHSIISLSPTYFGLDAGEDAKLYSMRAKQHLKF